MNHVEKKSAIKYFCWYFDHQMRTGCMRSKNILFYLQNVSMFIPFRCVQCAFHLCSSTHSRRIISVFNRSVKGFFEHDKLHICFQIRVHMLSPHTMFQESSQSEVTGFNAGKRRGQVVGKFLEITRSSQRGQETLSLLFGLCEMVHHLAWIWKP